MVKLAIYFLSGLLTFSLARGQAPQAASTPGANAPLTFNTWMQQRISEAQSQLHKVSSVRRPDEKQVARARETLTNASELTVEEYISVYLTTLTNDRDGLVKLSEKLTKDEAADIIGSLLKRLDAEQRKSVPVATTGSATLIK